MPKHTLQAFTVAAMLALNLTENELAQLKETCTQTQPAEDSTSESTLGKKGHTGDVQTQVARGRSNLSA